RKNNLQKVNGEELVFCFLQTLGAVHHSPEVIALRVSPKTTSPGRHHPQYQVTQSLQQLHDWFLTPEDEDAKVPHTTVKSRPDKLFK
ncbi:hypothetical protein STEG23_031083, partial [Scotinomys teguina]